MTTGSEVRRYIYKSLFRVPLLWQLRGLVDWNPLSSSEPGYTIAIAGMHKLWPVAIANLRLIAKCDLDGLREVILVLDQCLDHTAPRLKELLKEIQNEGLNVRLVGYDSTQMRVSRRINWGWVYSWLSWSKGVGESRTRWVLLHDLDAMPIDRQIFQKLYLAAVESDCRFQGIRFYSGNGVNHEMRLVTTFEMVLDCEWLRRTSKPIECFNQIRLLDGRYIDFDTLLDVQRRTPRRQLEPISEMSLVHPTQLICQYTDLVAGRLGRVEKSNKLPILQYFMHLGDPSLDLSGLGIQIADTVRNRATLFDHEVDISTLDPSLWAWMEKQIRRLEQSLYGRTRPHIEEFLEGFIVRAGTERSVGNEPLEDGGVADM